MSEPQSPSDIMRTVCMPCAGSGDLDRHVGRLRDGKIITGIVLDECWFCKGDGWIRFARRVV
ncbi:hypothetical protein [Stackebrandtia soli]|uniref:hypothetical protein n=1 Tax=Stackebrandtia soli TaxID=1892856 RepID=UPI0039E77C5B